MHRVPWPAILGLFAPLAGLAFALKSIAFLYVEGSGSPRDLLDLLRGALAFYAAAALLCAVAAGLALRPHPPRALRLGVAAAAAVLAALEIAAFNFYVATGATFDARLALHALRRADELAAVVGSELAPSLGGLLLAVLAFRGFGPRTARWRGIKPLRSGRWLAGAAAVGIAAAGLASSPALSGLDRYFVRAPAQNLAASWWTRFRAPPGRPQPVTTRALRLVEAPDADRPNLVVIVLESVRAPSTSVHDRELDTTPFLAELARTSLVALDAQAVVPHTSKALVSIFCGVAPYLELDILEALAGAIPARCLPDLLREAGYRSAFFQSATESFERRRAVVENLGFDDFVPVEAVDTGGFERVGYFGYEDDVLLAPSARWLEARAGAPFLLGYLTVVPHHPYEVPRAFAGGSGDDEEAYLAAVAYVDRFVARVFARFEALGLREDTIFLVLGDHGEAFGEHGRQQHDLVLWQEGLHIPLLVHAPGRVAPGQIAKPVSHLDVVPTLVDLLGARLEGGPLPGESLRAPARERPLYAYCYYELRCAARRLGGWKYLHHFGERPDELFDLRADPGERENVAARHPERARAARRDLLGWVGDTLATQRRALESGFAR